MKKTEVKEESSSKKKTSSTKAGTKAKVKTSTRPAKVLKSSTQIMLDKLQGVIVENYEL